MTGEGTVPDTGLLRPAPPGPAVEELFAGDRDEAGYVMSPTGSSWRTPRSRCGGR